MGYYDGCRCRRISLPGGQEPRFMSVDVSVFTQNERRMADLFTVASRWNTDDLKLFGLVFSVSWYLHPISH